jgi:hypothetical protein
VLLLLSPNADGRICSFRLLAVSDDMYGRHYWDMPISAITPLVMKVCWVFSLPLPFSIDLRHLRPCFSAHVSIVTQVIIPSLTRC